MTIEQAVTRLKAIRARRDCGEYLTEELVEFAIRSLEAWQKVIGEINKEKEDAMFKPNSDFYDGVFYALGFTLGVIDKELEKVGEQDG